MTTQTLDLTRLDPWIRQYVPEFNGPLKAEKFAGGQSNPTFKLTAVSNNMFFVASHRPLYSLQPMR